MARKNIRTAPLEKLTDNEREVRAINDAGFEGYDVTLHGKCRKPEKYGIQRIPAAERALGAPPTSPRKDNRKFEHRYSFRLPTGENKKLLQAFARSNCKNYQEFFRCDVVGFYLSEYEKREQV